MRITPISPSARARTARILIISRVRLTSKGSSTPSRVSVMLISEPTGPRILSTASAQRQAQHRFAVDVGDEVAGLQPGLGGGRLVDRRHHLDEAVLHGDLDAEAAELALGLLAHVLEGFRAADRSSAGRARPACRRSPTRSAFARRPARHSSCARARRSRRRGRGTRRSSWPSCPAPWIASPAYGSIAPMATPASIALNVFRIIRQLPCIARSNHSAGSTGSPARRSSIYKLSYGIASRSVVGPSKNSSEAGTGPPRSPSRSPASTVSPTRRSTVAKPGQDDERPLFRLEHHHLAIVDQRPGIAHGGVPGRRDLRIGGRAQRHALPRPAPGVALAKARHG